MRAKGFKEKLKKGEYTVGTWCEIPSPELINVLAKAGLDFVIVDMEHGVTSFETASRMVMAAEAEGCSPLIRVPQNNGSDILRALEIAPEGIIIPHVRSISERDKVIQAMKFWPAGQRSLNPYTRAGQYHVSPFYTEKQNKDVLSCIIIEDKKGIKNFAEIIDNKEIDIIYVGTYDISASLGIPGDTTNKKVTDTLERLIKIIKSKKKIAGTLFHTKKEFEYYKKLGFQFLCYKVDTGVIFDAFSLITHA